MLCAGFRRARARAMRRENEPDALGWVRAFAARLDSCTSASPWSWYLSGYSTQGTSLLEPGWSGREHPEYPGAPKRWPSPGADVGSGRGKSRCRCGRGEPSRTWPRQRARSARGNRTECPTSATRLKIAWYSEYATSSITIRLAWEVQPVVCRLTRWGTAGHAA